MVRHQCGGVSAYLVALHKIICPLYVLLTPPSNMGWCHQYIHCSGVIEVHITLLMVRRVGIQESVLFVHAYVC